mgnify:CR=1 FL=1|tara:strand:+ start:358 stop:2010 length:1653 start_codon:yes stop_codon:yes gene_type:complete
MTDTQTVIQARPRYIQDIDEALLGRIFGTPDEFGVLSGGLIDDPDLFQIPNYVQAQSGLQDAVAGTFATPEQRQAFMDRYQTYFTDDQGVARYLPEAAAGLQQGLGTIGTAISDYFPDAKTYLQEGRGDIGAKDIFDTELSKARSKADQGTGTFDAKSRANALLGDARSEIQGGLGQASKVDVEEGGEFGARDAFKRGTRRALQLAEEGLGRFDPVARTQEFMDPYKEQVVDAALRKIDREGAKRRQAGAAKAIGAGAFGGSRAGVQAAETERAIEETRQDTIANLMSQGYDKALASAMATDEAARKRSLQASGLTGELGARGAGLESKAFEDAAKRGLAATSTEAQLNQKAFEDAMRRQLSGGTALGDIGRAQLGAESGAFEAGKNRMLKAADMYRSMGLSSAEAQARAAQDEKKRSLEAGRLMGGLGSTLGQLGGAQGNIGKAYGALAGQSANIGQAYAGMAPADLGFMYELGGKERQYGQQYEDMLRKNQLLTTQEALAPYSYAQNFLTGSPSASIYGEFTSQPSSAPNPFLSGVGAYTAGQGFMQQ